GGRAQVAAFSDLASMARRMRQRVRIVALVPEADLPPPDAAPRGCVVREPGELLDHLAERCTPVGLWLPADPVSVSSSPPAGLLALFAPTGGAQIGCVALATEPAIVDPSRPPSIPRPVPPSGAHDSIDSGERAAISPPAAPSADEGQPDAGTGA